MQKKAEDLDIGIQLQCLLPAKAFYTIKELGLASCGVSVCVVVDWYGIG